MSMSWKTPEQGLTSSFMCVLSVWVSVILREFRIIEDSTYRVQFLLQREQPFKLSERVRKYFAFKRNGCDSDILFR